MDSKLLSSTNKSKTSVPSNLKTPLSSSHKPTLSTPMQNNTSNNIDKTPASSKSTPKEQNNSSSLNKNPKNFQTQVETTIEIDIRKETRIKSSNIQTDNKANRSNSLVSKLLNGKFKEDEHIKSVSAAKPISHPVNLPSKLTLTQKIASSQQKNSFSDFSQFQESDSSQTIFLTPVKYGREYSQKKFSPPTIEPPIEPTIKLPSISQSLQNEDFMIEKIEKKPISQRTQTQSKQNSSTKEKSAESQKRSSIEPTLVITGDSQVNPVMIEESSASVDSQTTVSHSQFDAHVKSVSGNSQKTLLVERSNEQSNSRSLDGTVILSDSKGLPLDVEKETIQVTPFENKIVPSQAPSQKGTERKELTISRESQIKFPSQVKISQSPRNNVPGMLIAQDPIFDETSFQTPKPIKKSQAQHNSKQTQSEKSQSSKLQEKIIEQAAHPLISIIESEQAIKLEHNTQKNSAVSQKENSKQLSNTSTNSILAQIKKSISQSEIPLAIPDPNIIFAEPERKPEKVVATQGTSSNEIKKLLNYETKNKNVACSQPNPKLDLSRLYTSQPSLSMPFEEIIHIEPSPVLTQIQSGPKLDLKSMLIMENKGNSDKDNELASIDGKKYNLYEDWCILKVMNHYKDINGTIGLSSDHLWSNLKYHRNLLNGTRSAQSMRNRYMKLRDELREEDMEKIKAYVERNGEEILKKRCLRFRKDHNLLIAHITGYENRPKKKRCPPSSAKKKYKDKYNNENFDDSFMSDSKNKSSAKKSITSFSDDIELKIEPTKKLIIEDDICNLSKRDLRIKRINPEAPAKPK